MKRANIYTNSTGTNTFNPETFEAHSYRWWLYVKKFGDRVIFNNYSYSKSTSKHQGDMWKLLRDLGHGYYEAETIEAPEGLDKLDASIEYYQNLIAGLERDIARPRTRKSTNEKRREQIAHYQGKIALVNELKQFELDQVAAQFPNEESLQV